MPKPGRPHAHLHPTDLRALARLLADATAGVAGVVESVHVGVAPAAAGGLAPLTYRAIRNTARLLGAGVHVALAPVDSRLDAPPPSPQRRAALAALNGLVGDYLAESGSPLALPMTVRAGGVALPSDPAALAAALPAAGERVLLLIHGLCLNDACWQCAPDPARHDLGLALAAELGYTPLALSYNSGAHVSANGRDLAALLETLLAAWPRPVADLVLIGHSMGGLVARSAIHYGAAAGHRWPERLRALVCLGTPHHGAPLERRGNRLGALMELSPYVAPFARLGKGRSAGITDLRYGSLVDEDWHGRDRFAHGPDDRAAVPLPPGVPSYAVAASLGAAPSGAPDDDTLSRLPGDGLVPLDSALGRHPDPARALPFRDTWIAYGMGHRDLLTRPEVVERVQRWLA